MSPSMPPAVLKPGHPLQLGRHTRSRLEGAVRILLADPTLAGLPDAARLAALVLYAKSSADSTRTRIWAAELGRWLGVSESSVDHAVLPALRTSQALRSRAITDARGRVTGLECVVMPLWQARQDRPGHPLALSRRELATLLRLCEALFGPGWAPAHRSPTAPGLLASRRGRGAATDRLALLLMTLQTRPNGSLRLCGGTVDHRRGRPATTVARLLGCSASAGGKVLDRLRQQGLVEMVRKETGSGLRGATRVHLAAVARAHAPTQASIRQPRPRAYSTGPARGVPLSAAAHERPDAAPGWTAADFRVPSQATRAAPAPTPARPEHPGATPLHTHHPSVVTPDPESPGSTLGSGEAVGGFRQRCRDAHSRAREAEPTRNLAQPQPCAEQDALRTDHRTTLSPTAPCHYPPHAPRIQRRDVQAVLAAIAPLRDQLPPRQLPIVGAAIGAVLRTTDVGKLSTHLQARFAPMSLAGPAGDRGVIANPLAWLLSQLPQVTLCPRCDRTFHGSRTGKQLCPTCAARPRTAECEGCGRHRELSDGLRCPECQLARRSTPVSCSSCLGTDRVSAATWLCTRCESQARALHAPELANLDPQGQDLRLRLLRRSARKPPPKTQLMRRSGWAQRLAALAPLPLPEDYSEDPLPPHLPGAGKLSIPHSGRTSCASPRPDNPCDPVSEPAPPRARVQARFSDAELPPINRPMGFRYMILRLLQHLVRTLMFPVHTAGLCARLRRKGTYRRFMHHVSRDDLRIAVVSTLTGTLLLLSSSAALASSPLALTLPGPIGTAAVSTQAALSAKASASLANAWQELHISGRATGIKPGRKVTLQQKQREAWKTLPTTPVINKSGGYTLRVKLGFKGKVGSPALTVTVH